MKRRQLPPSITCVLVGGAVSLAGCEPAAPLVEPPSMPAADIETPWNVAANVDVGTRHVQIITEVVTGGGMGALAGIYGEQASAFCRGPGTGTLLVRWDDHQANGDVVPRTREYDVTCKDTLPTPPPPPPP